MMLRHTRHAAVASSCMHSDCTHVTDMRPQTGGQEEPRLALTARPVHMQSLHHPLAPSATLTSFFLAVLDLPQLKGYRRVFAHTADIFFVRGIARPETVSIFSSSWCWQVLGSHFKRPTNALGAHTHA